MTNESARSAGGLPALRRLRIPPFLRELTGCLLCGALLTLGCETIFRQSLPQALARLFHGGSGAAAALFLGAELAALTALVRLRPLALVLTALPPLALTLVSYYKIIINGFPLLLSDLNLAPTAASVISFALPRVRFSALTVSVPALLLAGIVLLSLRAALLPRDARQRMLLLALTLPLALSYLHGGEQQLRAARRIDGCQTQEERNDRCGVLYGFYAAWAAQNTAGGAGDESLPELTDLLEATEPEAAPAEPAAAPDIIFLLSESFFDITKWDLLHFETDPLPNFHRLASAYESGVFLSSTYAGGTGNVEVEMLTGFLGAFLDESDSMTALSREGVYESMPSIPRMLRDGCGYDTLYLHAYDSTLYNRPDVMPALGFDKLAFLADFETEYEYAGGYPSDESFVRELLARLDVGPDAPPLFIQATSMENHQPYTAEKYGEPSPVAYTCDVPLSDEEHATLDALITGLNHADASLGTLTDALALRERPTLLVFYGDHLPSLVSDGKDVRNGTLYSRIGLVPGADTLSWSPDTLMLMMSTDYLIWSSDGMAAAEGAISSASLLGVHALSRAGVPLTPFYSWLDGTLSREMLLARPRLFVTGDGRPLSDVPPESEQIVGYYRAIERDTVYGEGTLPSLFRPERIESFTK